MAAPVFAQFESYNFKDAKGQNAKMRVLLGDATVVAEFNDATNLTPLLQAVSNATVVNTTHNGLINHTPGTAAVYETVEDKVIMTYYDPSGFLHRYSVAAPASAIFLADGETADIANAAYLAVVTFFQAHAYGRYTDTATLVHVGGTRQRRKLQRKFNIFTRNPALSGPGE